MKIKLKLVDIDCCVYHKYRAGNYASEPHQEWVIQSNPLLLTEMVDDVVAGGYDKLILGYGTNRQAYEIDCLNSNRGGTFAPVLPLLQKYLAKIFKILKILNINVWIEPLLMADIYGKKEFTLMPPRKRSVDERNLRAGESYENILRHHYGSKAERGKIEHAQCVFDHSKVSLLYAQIHRVASLRHDTDEIVVDFYDDTSKILDGLGGFFAEYPELLPKNVVLNLKSYKGGQVELQRTICGTGKVDKNYDWSTRYLAAKFCHHGKLDDDEITTTEQLQHYHENDCYRDVGRKLEMGQVGGLFDRSEPSEVANFIEMRKAINEKLTSHPDLMAGAYTTYDELKVKELIPSDWDRDVSAKKEDTPLPNPNQASQPACFDLQTDPKSTKKPAIESTLSSMDLTKPLVRLNRASQPPIFFEPKLEEQGNKGKENTNEPKRPTLKRTQRIGGPRGLANPPLEFFKQLNDPNKRKADTDNPSDTPNDTPNKCRKVSSNSMNSSN